MSSSGWRGRAGFSSMESSLFSILLSTPVSMVPSFQPSWSACSLCRFCRLRCSAEESTGNNRLVEDVPILQHTAEGSRRVCSCPSCPQLRCWSFTFCLFVSFGWCSWLWWSLDKRSSSGSKSRRGYDLRPFHLCHPHAGGQFLSVVLTLPVWARQSG